MSQKRLANLRNSLTIGLLIAAILIAEQVEVTAYSGLLPADAASPGKCLYRGDTIPAGINNGIAPCQRLTCNEDGSIFVEGCGKLRIENCNRGERMNPGKPFPECCKLKYKCKEAGRAPYFIERDTADRA